MKTYSNADARAEMARNPGFILVATKHDCGARYCFSGCMFQRLADVSGAPTKESCDVDSALFCFDGSPKTDLGLVPESQYLAEPAKKEGEPWISGAFAAALEQSHLDLLAAVRELFQRVEALLDCDLSDYEIRVALEEQQIESLNKLRALAGIPDTETPAEGE